MPAVTVETVTYPRGGGIWQYQARSGVPHGWSRTYYPDGSLKVEGHYDGGRKHGLFVFHSPDDEVVQRQLFVRDVQVWISKQPEQLPPAHLLAQVDLEPGQTNDEPDTSLTDVVASSIDNGPPEPYFVSLSRTSPVTRFGLNVGGGGSVAEQSSTQRAAVYGHYLLGPYGLLLQVDGSRLQTMTETISGRTTLEVSGSYHRDIEVGRLSPHIGLAVPVANDTSDGHEAAVASSYQRPGDAVTALASTVAIRSGVSFTHGVRRAVVQGDAGIDWALGGAGETVRPFGRFNAGVGIGTRSLSWLLEVSSSVRLDQTSQRLMGIGTGPLVWMRGVWLTALVSRTSDGHTTLVSGAGYGF